MSTRSVLAYKTIYGWRGVYCHWDGYPSNRGQQIWDILMKKFILNRGKLSVVNDGETAIQSFIDIYIKGHPSGWSSFPKECYCHSPEFVMRDGVRDNWETDKDTNPLFIEWVYVIDPENKKLIIYTGARDEGEHKETSFDGREWSQANYKHYLVCEIELNSDKRPPDFKEIERIGNELSNEMYDKFGKKEV